MRAQMRTHAYDVVDCVRIVRITVTDYCRKNKTRQDSLICYFGTVSIFI